MLNFVSQKEAIDLAYVVAAESTIPDAKKEVMEFLVTSCPTVEFKGELYYSYDDIKAFYQNFRKWWEEKDSSLLRRKRGYKIDKIPDVIEFVESKRYMNQKGGVYPVVADTLWDIWHTPGKQYVEIVLTGSTGVGKSFMLEMCMAYFVGRLSWLHDPQAELDLAMGSPLHIALQAGTLAQASNILFKPLYNRMAMTEYFTKVFPFQKDIRSELIFPNAITIRAFSGNDDAVLGLTVVAAGVTELNRMSYIQRSTRGRKKSAQDLVYDQAVAIYQTLIRRMVGRTMQLGKLWGFLVLDAAHEHEEDFTSQKIKEARTNPHIFIYKKKQWEVVPRLQQIEDTFMVEVGDDTHRSRIIETVEEAINPDKIERIPSEYLQFFRTDCEGALRDFGGIVIGSASPAIPFREKIAEGYESFRKVVGGDQQFFRVNDANLTDFKDFVGEEDRWEDLINMDYIRSVILDRRTQMCLHLDPSVKHDAMGIAIGHVAGWSLLPMVKRYNARTRKYEEHRDARAPISMIDGILRVVSRYGEEVDLDMAQRLILLISQIKEFELAFVTIDSYQSAQMLQAWSASDITCGIISVDNTLEPYTRTKIAYRDGRLWTPEHPTYRTEIADLQLEGGKYDHLPEGSKDCSDAVAGVTYMLETHIADYVPTKPSNPIVSEVEPMPGGRRGRLIGIQ